MDKGQLENCLKEGISQRDIADRFGTSQTNVRYWMTKYSLTKQKKTKPEPEAYSPPIVKLPMPPAANAKKDTSFVGSMNEARVLAGLTCAGFPCYIPFGTGKADLLIETSEGIRSIQCKKGRFMDDTQANFVASVSTVLRSGGYLSYHGIIDYIAITTPGIPGVYLVPVEETGTGVVTLRLLPPLNNQMKGVRMAKDYLVPGTDGLLY